MSPAPVESLAQFTPRALGELKAWLEPWFPKPTVRGTALLVIDGAGAAITTGIAGEFTIHYPCRIIGWRLLGDQSGSIQLDVWKADYASYPPTVADSITGASPPLLSSAQANQSSDVSDWDTAVVSGDTFIVNVDSAATVTRVVLALALHKRVDT